MFPPSHSDSPQALEEAGVGDGEALIVDRRGDGAAGGDGLAGHNDGLGEHAAAGRGRAA